MYTVYLTEGLCLYVGTDAFQKCSLQSLVCLINIFTDKFKLKVHVTNTARQTQLDKHLFLTI